MSEGPMAGRGDTTRRVTRTGIRMDVGCLPILAVISVALLLVAAGMMWGLPQYQVYRARMNGRARLMQAEQEKKILIERRGPRSRPPSCGPRRSKPWARRRRNTPNTAPRNLSRPSARRCARAISTDHLRAH